MSDVEWDAEDFEPAGPTKPVSTDKWEGEDEDDDIKDNWDDEEEEKQDITNEKIEAPVKKKKSMKEIIAAKEEKRRKEAEEKRLKAEEELKARTPEMLVAEKLRQQKLQEEADLEVAMETFGVTNEDLKGKGIDKMNPVTSEEFEEFGEMLKEKILQFEKSAHYVGMLDSLFREVCTGLDAEEIKKLGSTLNTLGNEKTKIQKGKGKKKSKKASMNVGKTAGFDDYQDFGNEYDDFI